MLVNLHVKNLALIQEADIDFKKGLNILTGETGAGKSIVIGSINLALGGKSSKDVIRAGKEYALVELVFLIEDKDIIRRLCDMDILNENERQIIISRKIMDGYSLNKINGVTVNVSVLKEVTGMLVDIHGQHDHQSLLNKGKHLEFLDFFAGDALQKIQDEYAVEFKKYIQLKKEFSSFDLDEEQRQREVSLLRYELNEIAEVNISVEEDEAIQTLYKKMNGFQKIIEILGSVYENLENIDYGKDIRNLSSILDYDEEIKSVHEILHDLESISGDLKREVSSYIERTTFDEDQMFEISSRLDAFNKLKIKYGNSVEKIHAYSCDCEKKLSILENYEESKKKAEQELNRVKENLELIAKEMSNIRKAAGIKFSSRIKEELLDLNFLAAEFEILFTQKDSFDQKGIDEVEFLISTNPGEPKKPLSKVASGGELSRIMLALKTIFAKQDHIPTLIFDEIDTGISGKTAAKVAKRLSVIAKNHQIICITHLGQIAAMSDYHYLIEKTASSGETKTEILSLDSEKSIEEIARLSGGDVITEITIKNAKELVEMSNQYKDNI